MERRFLLNLAMAAFLFATGSAHAELSQDEKDFLLNLINQARAQGHTCKLQGQPDQVYGPAPALAWNNLLAAAAERHSLDLAVNNIVVSDDIHRGTDGSHIDDRIRDTGYQPLLDYEVVYIGGEDPFTNQSPRQGWLGNAVDWWLNVSEFGHCQVLMNPDLKDMGGGGAVNPAGQAPDGQKRQYWFTVDFGASSQPAIPPAATLQSLHSGCDAESKSQTADCVAATHRFCAGPIGLGAGIAQEVGQNVLGVACFTPNWYGDVSLADLTGRHPGCHDGALSRSPDCVSAIHRACAQGSLGGAGVSQEVGAGVLGVACFHPSWYGDVALEALRAEHPGCDSLGKSQHPDCMAAVHRWCSHAGVGGAGLAQEVGNGVFGVACFWPGWYGDAAIR
jgi:uncharacterized protein YkwD